MLMSLTIKNLALIEDLQLDFSEAFNVITGETGAGKTIILEALGLALGRKASAVQVRQGAAKLTVSAVFEDIPRRVQKLVREMELGGEEANLILRREVDAAGKSRAFVNDQPASLGTLAVLGEFLVYMHGQHDNQLLMKPAEQRDLLDAFGELGDLTAAVAGAYSEWKRLDEERKSRTLNEQERIQKIDLYKFQLDEMTRGRLKEGEDEEWERLLPQLRNSGKIAASAQEVYDSLYGNDASVLSLLKRVEAGLKNLDSLGVAMQGAAENLKEAVVRIQEISRQVESSMALDEASPEKLEEALNRLDVIGKLKKKYGPTLKDVIDARERVARELEVLENWDVKAEELASQLKKAEQDLNKKCAKLHEARLAAAKKLASAVQKEFREVGLPKAAFTVGVDKREIPTAAGADDVKFLFSPNPGEGEKILAEVASGGELSRVMLALETVLSEANEVPLLIFDEIDAGVGGMLGGVIGKKLARLSKQHQIVCITHLASIAACADKHFAVEKEIKASRTRTLVKDLEKEDRVLEIARLFGGVKVPEKGDSVSVKHARELLQVSRN